MKVLGIDPGLALTGWAVIEKKDTPKVVSYGCIATDKKFESSRRLKLIYLHLTRIIKRFQPNILVLENVFFNSNMKTAFQIGEARGIIKLASVFYKLKLVEFTPLQVKQAIAGYGRATKKQIQQMVKLQLGLKTLPKPDDTADALALSLTYCFFNQKLVSY